jgi:hypothetical protein
MRPASTFPAEDAAVVRCVSNLPGLPERVRDVRLDNHALPSPSAGWGSAFGLALRLIGREAVVLYIPSHGLVGLLCLLCLLPPLRRKKIVVVDLILALPRPTAWGRVGVFLKRLLFRRVDLFIVHQRDTRGHQDHFGIRAERMRFVPFMVPHWAEAQRQAPAEGAYVYSGGMSRRDFATFCRAMAGLPYPAVLVTPPDRENARHKTAFDPAVAPPNVRVRRDVATPEAWVGLMAGARVVVVATLRGELHAPGLGTYLLGMALRKCVIVTESGATRGLLEPGRHAVVVPAGEWEPLRAAIRRAWEDDAHRESVAAAGHAYAQAVGGEEGMLEKVAAEVVRLLRPGRVSAG